MLRRYNIRIRVNNETSTDPGIQKITGCSVLETVELQHRNHPEERAIRFLDKEGRELDPDILQAPVLISTQESDEAGAIAHHIQRALQEHYHIRDEDVQVVVCEYHRL